MADTKPSPVHNPAPSNQPCTSPNPTGQPSPAPQAHSPSWAQPSLAHGSQYATQPSLHSQPTAQPKYFLRTRCGPTGLAFAPLLVPPSQQPALAQDQLALTASTAPAAD
jgi:hypothetical protein